MSHITSIFIHQDLISTEEAKEIDLVHYDNEVCVEPTTKLCELQSHRFRRHQLSEKGGRLLRIQLLSSQPSLQLSTRDLVSMGHHYLRLFGNVGNGSVHLLEFQVRRPIRARTRFLEGWRS
jgi:hypothetical protein